MIRSLLVIAATTFIATLATAHEFWIQPDTFTPIPGQPFRVRLMHGERFAGNPVPRVESSIDRFELVTRDGDTLPVRGLSGSTVSFSKSSGTPSTIIYKSRWISNTLPAPRFNAYLETEGLHAITVQRQLAGETENPGRERYMRCAKALLVPVTPVDHAAHTHTHTSTALDHPLGLPCEIVLESVSGSGPTRTITARVLYHGEPLPDQLVVAVAQANPGALLQSTTDSEGRVIFTGTPRGPWMLTTLHMSRVDQNETDLGNTPQADWQSLWASVAFSIDH